MPKNLERRSLTEIWVQKSTEGQKSTWVQKLIKMSLKIPLKWIVSQKIDL